MSTTIIWQSPDVLSSYQQFAINEGIISALDGDIEASTCVMLDEHRWKITVCGSSIEERRCAAPNALDRANVAKWMKNGLELSPDDFRVYGEFNSTRLAEMAADALDLDLGDDNATIPEWVFELSINVIEDMAQPDAMGWDGDTDAL